MPVSKLKLHTTCLLLLGVWTPKAIGQNPRSCVEANGPTGIYTLRNGRAYCDMDTDGGGWTLVGSSRTTFNDQGSGYYTDLTTLRPGSSAQGIWDGLRAYYPPIGDIRFSCKRNRFATNFDVDLAFYQIQWYNEITASRSDAQVCFEQTNGQHDTSPTPRRCNLRNGQCRNRGDLWNRNGYLEGEDYCGDTGDFTVDFDDRGMDSNQGDGTDWGEDDSSRKCGTNNVRSDAAWFVWFRPHEPLSANPTANPSTPSPTGSPATSSPTRSPTMNPTTSSPTTGPTISPTMDPTTSSPTTGPTISPTTSPTSNPSRQPTGSPTRGPIVAEESSADGPLDGSELTYLIIIVIGGLLLCMLVVVAVILARGSSSDKGDKRDPAVASFENPMYASAAVPETAEPGQPLYDDPDFEDKEDASSYLDVEVDEDFAEDAEDE